MMKPTAPQPIDDEIDHKAPDPCLNLPLPVKLGLPSASLLTSPESPHCNYYCIGFKAAEEKYTVMYLELSESKPGYDLGAELKKLRDRLGPEDDRTLKYARAVISHMFLHCHAAFRFLMETAGGVGKSKKAKLGHRLCTDAKTSELYLSQGGRRLGVHVRSQSEIAGPAVVITLSPDFVELTFQPI
jgi:hypothetical protein